MEAPLAEAENLAAPAASRLANDLRRGIRELPEPQREALLLHYIEGLSQAEIAVVLGRTPAAVNSLLQRARAAVRRSALWNGEEALP